MVVDTPQHLGQERTAPSARDPRGAGKGAPPWKRTPALSAPTPRSRHQSPVTEGMIALLYRRPRQEPEQPYTLRFSYPLVLQHENSLRHVGNERHPLLDCTNYMPARD